MSALLAPKVVPPMYLHTVEAQDRARAALSALTDQLHAVEVEWVDAFMAFLPTPAQSEEHRRWSARLDELDAQVEALEAEIARAKEGLL